MVNAALGAEISVPNIDGSQSTIKIPHGTQSGAQFKLKGRGMPSVNSSKTGDLVAEVVVETPVSLSKKQKEILLQFASEKDDQTNSPKSSEFIRKIKDLFS
jgi:molecular chaperone DnaJ